MAAISDDKDEENQRKGREGERKVNSVLEKFLPKEYHLITNVTLPFDDDGKQTSSQIDHVVVSRYGIFVIETKHWKASTAERYKNPKTQNIKHIKALQQCLKIAPEKFFPITVMIIATENSEAQNLPQGTVSLKELVAEITGKKEAIFNEDEVNELFAQIEHSREPPDRQTDEEHIARVSRKKSKPADKSWIDEQTKIAKAKRNEKVFATLGLGFLLLLMGAVWFYVVPKINVGEVVSTVSEKISPAAEVTVMPDPTPATEPEVTVTPEPEAEVTPEPEVKTEPEVNPSDAEVAELLRQAAIARTENRPAKEMAALQKVLAIEPNHADAKTRLNELQTEIRRQKFRDAVRSAQLGFG